MSSSTLSSFSDSTHLKNCESSPLSSVTDHNEGRTTESSASTISTLSEKSSNESFNHFDFDGLDLLEPKLNNLNVPTYFTDPIGSSFTVTASPFSSSTFQNPQLYLGKDKSKSFSPNNKKEKSSSYYETTPNIKNHTRGQHYETKRKSEREEAGTSKNHSPVQNLKEFLFPNEFSNSTGNNTYENHIKKIHSSSTLHPRKTLDKKAKKYKEDACSFKNSVTYYTKNQSLANEKTFKNEKNSSAQTSPFDTTAKLEESSDHSNESKFVSNYNHGYVPSPRKKSKKLRAMKYMINSDFSVEEDKYRADSPKSAVKNIIIESTSQKNIKFYTNFADDSVNNKVFDKRLVQKEDPIIESQQISKNLTVGSVYKSENGTDLWLEHTTNGPFLNKSGPNVSKSKLVLSSQKPSQHYNSPNSPLLNAPKHHQEYAPNMLNNSVVSNDSGYMRDEALSFCENRVHKCLNQRSSSIVNACVINPSIPHSSFKVKLGDEFNCSSQTVFSIFKSSESYEHDEYSDDLFSGRDIGSGRYKKEQECQAISDSEDAYNHGQCRISHSSTPKESCEICTEPYYERENNIVSDENSIISFVRPSIISEHGTSRKRAKKGILNRLEQNIQLEKKLKTMKSLYEPKYCSRCKEKVLKNVDQEVNGNFYHNQCFTCANPKCQQVLDLSLVYPFLNEIFCDKCGPTFSETCRFFTKSENVYQIDDNSMDITGHIKYVDQCSELEQIEHNCKKAITFKDPFLQALSHSYPVPEICVGCGQAVCSGDMEIVNGDIWHVNCLKFDSNRGKIVGILKNRPDN